MSDLETSLDASPDVADADAEILDVTIIEDVDDEQVVGTSCTPSPVTNKRSSAR
jgi:hypothetical protein